MKLHLILALALLSISLKADTGHPAIRYIFPLPNSTCVTTKTTIIMKPDSSLLTQISDPADLIEVKTDNNVLGGTTYFATDNFTIIRKLDHELARGRTVEVTIKLQPYGFDDFQTSFSTAEYGNNAMPSVLKKRSAASSQVIESDEVTPVRLINGKAVPSDYPEIETTIHGETAPGRIFFGTNFPKTGYSTYIIIMENDGTPWFYRRYDALDGVARFTAHPATGQLSFHQYEIYDVLLDQTFAEMDTIFPGHGYWADDHELQLLENGHTLLIAREAIGIDMNDVIGGGRTNASVEAHHFQELDQNRDVVFEWRSWDYLDIRDTFVDITGGSMDYVHMNSVALDFDGHFIISIREFSLIMKIHRITGDVIWKWGGNQNEFDWINEDRPFTFQHDARPIKGKPGQYLMFDNGRGSDPAYSRSVEYKLDTEAMTAEKVWEYADKTWYTGWMGSTQRLSNGNTLIDWPSCDWSPDRLGMMRVTEVNANKNLLWEMQVVTNMNYRCRRYEWDGMMQQPYLIIENMGSVIRLIFHKFGDANVAYYNIYAGNAPDALALIDSTRKTWADINTAMLEGAQQYFSVTAVNTAGEESGFSNRETTRIQVTTPGENIVNNGDFENGFDHWNWWEQDADADYEVNGGQLHFIIRNGGNANWNIQAIYPGIVLIRGNTYRIEFDAWADKNRVVWFDVGKNGDPWTDFSRIGGTALARNKKHYAYEFTMNDLTEPNARIVLNVGTNDADVYVDNVSLIQIVPSDVEESPVFPGDFSLGRNYPNPFNPVTNIQYTLPEQANIRIDITNVLGEVVQTIIDQTMEAGVYLQTWDASDLSTGVYFIHMVAEISRDQSDYHQIRKCLYLK
ncbi:aryl-sulfate sulfotransferase [bacterium]|nr:aryl-sulfate sulfotransferase [bacterium]